MKILGVELRKKNHAEYSNGKIERKPPEYFWGCIKLPERFGEWLWNKF